MTRRFFPARTPQQIPGQSISLGVTLTPIIEPAEVPECAPAIVRDPDGNIVAELRCGEEYQYVCAVPANITWWPTDDGIFFTESAAVGSAFWEMYTTPPYVTPPTQTGWAQADTFTQEFAIFKVPGDDASALTVDFQHVSGAVQSISISATSGEYALLSALIPFSPAGVWVESVYDVVTSAGTLRLNFRRYSFEG